MTNMDKAKVWVNKWQIPVAAAFIAIASFIIGAGVNHYSEVQNVSAVRASYRKILESKDIRIESLAREAGAAARNAAIATKNADNASSKAVQAAGLSSQAAESANAAAAKVERINTSQRVKK